MLLSRVCFDPGSKLGVLGPARTSSTRLCRSGWRYGGQTQRSQPHQARQSLRDGHAPGDVLSPGSCGKGAGVATLRPRHRLPKVRVCLGSCSAAVYAQDRQKGMAVQRLCCPFCLSLCWIYVKTVHSRPHRRFHWVFTMSRNRLQAFSRAPQDVTTGSPPRAPSHKIYFASRSCACASIPPTLPMLFQ